MALDVDASATYLDLHAGVHSQHRCAQFVRKALEAGGIKLLSRPGSAKDYGPALLQVGFTEVAVDSSYQPRKGDIIVLQAAGPNSVHGHVAMFDGHQWVSDFMQPDYLPGPEYRANPVFRIYRP